MPSRPRAPQLAGLPGDSGRLPICSFSGPAPVEPPAGAVLRSSASGEITGHPEQCQRRASCCPPRLSPRRHQLLQGSGPAIAQKGEKGIERKQGQRGRRRGVVPGSERNRRELILQVRSGVQLLTNERILDFTNLTQLLKQSSGHYTAYFRDACHNVFCCHFLVNSLSFLLKKCFFQVT